MRGSEKTSEQNLRAKAAVPNVSSGLFRPFLVRIRKKGMKDQMSAAMSELIDAMVDLQIKRKNYRMTPPPGSVGLNCDLLHAVKHGYVDHLICWLWKRHRALLIVRSRDDESGLFPINLKP